LDLRACIVAAAANGKITRINEYLDSAALQAFAM